MKIILSDHIINEKIPLIKSQGWNIIKTDIIKTVHNPKWQGFTKYGQPTFMSLVDERHILRIVYRKEEGGIIFVITAHIARRGTYESTK